ncbi:MAG: hypothetical protein C4531_09545 [Desulfurivibrio sp.]|nr:MAG: hypothetical protein C4531_09545 [Desulfurivibrio sp.]
MKPGNFLMFTPLLSAFVVFVWGVEQSHAQNLSAPGQFKITQTINPADSPAAAKQALAIRAAAPPSTGQMPPTAPKERSKPCR